MAPIRPQTPVLRHLVSINDLSNEEIGRIFDLAGEFLRTLADPNFDYKIGRGTDLAAGKILATLFFEPSTRTRLSFESSMLRLGGRVVTSADPATSSSAKGESLADSVRVISNYSDLIVIRHPRDGAARYAAEFATVPVINGGDGAHEHPTQTLCDLFTLQRENKTLKGLNVAISGDLRGSRTVHSFVYALARFGAHIMMMPAPGMGLPKHVGDRLREEFNAVALPKSKYPSKDSTIDALYVTPEEPHQLSLISPPDLEADVKVKIRNKIDAVYVTRFQKERSADKNPDYPKIDLKFLRGERYAETSVLHPLPRVGELDTDLDNDSRAVYFRQAAYGVPVRMALIALLLGAGDRASLTRYGGGFGQAHWPLYQRPGAVGIRCRNPNCIVHEASERQYVGNKFFLIGGGKPKLRCCYCEADIEEFVALDHTTGTIVHEIGTSALAPDIVFYADEAAAEAHRKRPRHSKAG